MKMKMYKISNYEAFMDLIDHCEGQVYIISKDGDRFNLKSKLTQFLALSKLFNSNIIEELEIETTNKEDALKIFSFMMDGNGNRD